MDQKGITHVMGVLFTVALLAIVWVVYNESADLANLGLGVVLGFVALMLTNKFVLKDDYRENYHVNLIAIFKYIPFIFLQIYLSGFDAIYRVFTGHVNVGVVEIKTKLPTEFQRSLLSNAITLTPGTVTLDQDGEDMTIIWLDCSTADPNEAGESIKGSFERILLPPKERT
ncbi:MAG: Na+/H+ antiporter subunit E [Spirochaeta sp.]|nr:Na+/H+ antiporter subunit E [Spirochaeta sp.]